MKAIYRLQLVIHLVVGLGALAVWIIVQCWILQSIVALHVIFFAVGAVQGLLALALLWLRGDWPLGLLKERLAAKGAK